MWQKPLNACRGNVYDIVLMEVWVSGGLARAQALVNSDLLLSTEKHLLPPGLFIPLDFPMSFLFRESSLLILKDTLKWNEYWREFCTWMTHQGSNCSCSFWRNIKTSWIYLLLASFSVRSPKSTVFPVISNRANALLWKCSGLHIPNYIPYFYILFSLRFQEKQKTASAFVFLDPS